MKSPSKFFKAAIVTAFGIAACLPSAITPTLSPATDSLTTVTPTPFVCEASLIEQSFERGFMFWIGQSVAEKCAESHTFARNSGEIWVAFATRLSPKGKWLIRIDDWDSSAEPEIDPSLIPPDGLFQPVRGFGKAWRIGLSEADRQALGWATGDELPYSTTYRYESSGFFNADGEFVQRPGKHIIQGLAGDTFIFDEVSQSVEYLPPKQ